MITKSFLFSIAAALCLCACGDKENNVLTPEPVAPVQVEPAPAKPEEPVEPDTRHSYKPVQLNEKEQAINAKLHEFSWKLFKEVYRGRKAGENLMISPISLEVDLGMFLNGLEGNSYQELLKTMGLQDYSKQELNSFFQTMMTGIEKADEAAIFKGANAFWYNQNRKANQTFLNAITNYYAARAEAMDFSNPQTKNIINAWCAEQTNDRIKDMVDRTDESDLFHLMNAVYFKADWDEPFDKQLTSKMPFQYANGKSEEVDMMYDVYEGTYAETEQYQLGVRPFVDGSFQMVFILPKKGVAMEDVIPAVLDYKVTITAEWYPGKPQQATIELYAPKFTSEYTEGHLFDYMKTINPNLKFDWHELSLMEEKEPLDLSALQKTFFLMDEEGAEAAAVTDIIAKNTSIGPSRVAQLHLDRPFIYAIVETNTSCPLFIGYYGK